jgi:Ca-activated chloride channel homolog
MVCFGGFANPADAAQHPDSAPPAPLQIATQLVKLDTSVIDKRGDFVGGLGRDNFRVFDDGVASPILFFAPVEAPAQVLVMIETSPAVYLIHNEHLAAAYALLGGLAADDQVALVTYDQSPRAVLGFTADKSALLGALGGLQYTIGMGDLDFFDSLSDVIDWMRPVPGKRAVVIITTGIDSSPPARWDALAAKLRGEDVVVYCVSLAGALRGEPGKKSKAKKPSAADPRADRKPDEDSLESLPPAQIDATFARADRALRLLATMTGGRAYFPSSDKDFVGIYHEIASALRHQYVLGIAPAHDGQFHSITVGVAPGAKETASGPAEVPAAGSDYRIYTRAGYLAPAP